MCMPEVGSLFARVDGEAQYEESCYHGRCRLCAADIARQNDILCIAGTEWKLSCGICI